MSALPQSQGWTSLEVLRAVDLYRQGMTCPAIARLLGRAESSVRRHLTHKGVFAKRVDAVVVVGENIEHVRAARARGVTLRTIAGQLGLTLAALWRAMERLGEPTSRHPSVPHHCTGVPVVGERLEKIVMAHQDNGRAAAALLGWPEADSATEARLMVLLAVELLSERDIAQRMGWSWREDIHCSTSARLYLGRLRRKGYLECEGSRPRKHRLVAWLRARKEDESR